MNKRYWLLVLLVASLTLSANAPSAETLLNIKAQAFDQGKVSQNSKLFEISYEGLITDGPRRAAGEPIDYSSIMRDELLGTMLFQSIFFCVEGVRHCSDKVFRLPSKNFRLKIASKNSTRSDVAEKVEKTLSNTLYQAGFKVAANDEKTTFLLTIVLGDMKSLEEYAKIKNDAYGTDFINLFTPQKQQSGTALFFDPCYLSTNLRNQGESSILIEDAYLEKCLPRLLLAAIGLDETSGWYPTATSVDSQYHVLTLADESFINTLYAPDFPLYGSGNDAMNYYKAHLAENGNFRSP